MLATIASGKHGDGSNFITAVQPVDGNTTGASEPVAATATLLVGGAGTLGAIIHIGSKIYTVSAGGLGANEIAQGTTAQEYADNLFSAINSSSPPEVTNIGQEGVNVLLAAEPGAAGNFITTSDTDPNLDISGFSGGADATADPKEPLMPVSIRIAAEGGSVAGGTIANPLCFKLVDGVGNVITFVDDGEGGWAIPVKVIP
jgi:hypothetical protein